MNECIAMSILPAFIKSPWEITFPEVVPSFEKYMKCFTIMSMQFIMHYQAIIALTQSKNIY